MTAVLIDRLDNPAVIRALDSRLKTAVDYLRNTSLTTLSLGRHDVDGDRVFALVQEYTTRKPEECVWEAHRMYIDVQYVVRGTERMGYANIADAREREAYDSARDVAFFEPGTDYVTVREGMFAIFGPEDVHSPCGAAGQPAPVRKIIVKVATATD
jgi:YhcH/YjgK/YiaL family protein